MQKLVPTRPVYEHSQDGPIDCGRACAQMVISSLAIGPPTGSSPTPADAKIQIPFTQDDLRQRELYPLDDISKVEWRTHPDELADLMRTAPELLGDLVNWRLSVNNSLDDVLNALAVALQAGKPAILNIYSIDHWVVVVGVGVEPPTSQVLFIEVLDPLPQGGVVTHTYIDNCKDGQEGVTFTNVSETDPLFLGKFQVEIGNTPSPGGLPNYHTKFVAVVHDGARPFTIEDKIWRRPPIRPRTPLYVAAADLVPPIPIEIARAALQQLATEWDIPHLRELLSGQHQHASVLVRDIQQELVPYYLVLFFRDAPREGVIGVFDPRHHAPAHFRFTRNVALMQSIVSQHQQELWWMRRPLPALGSPYFPFLRELRAGKFVYTRLFDSFSFELDVPL